VGTFFQEFANDWVTACGFGVVSAGTASLAPASVATRASPKTEAFSKWFTVWTFMGISWG
jgi:hypothetical protein